MVRRSSFRLSTVGSTVKGKRRARECGAPRSAGAESWREPEKAGTCAPTARGGRGRPAACYGASPDGSHPSGAKSLNYTLRRVPDNVPYIGGGQSRYRDIRGSERNIFRDDIMSGCRTHICCVKRRMSRLYTNGHPDTRENQKQPQEKHRGTHACGACAEVYIAYYVRLSFTVADHAPDDADGVTKRIKNN